MASNQPQTTDQQRDQLQQISDSDEAAIAEVISIRIAEAVDDSNLDAKTFALVNLAALIALGGDESSYLLHITAALDAGASVDEITAVLAAVGPNVGVSRWSPPPIPSRRRSAFPSSVTPDRVSRDRSRAPRST